MYEAMGLSQIWETGGDVTPVSGKIEYVISRYCQGNPDNHQKWI